MAASQPAANAQTSFTLDRGEAVPAVVGDPDHFLIIAGLSWSAKDVGKLTGEAPNAFLMGGGMGGAITMALGLALAQPERAVLAVFGDGECLMNASSLSTVGFMQPDNLAMLCVDNGTYGETGNQLTHTARNADLELIAKGCGIDSTMTVHSEEHYADAATLLRKDGAPRFILLRVSDAAPPAYGRNFDAVERKTLFRRALLG
tara:strand:+ start:288 stop:896 length:609 start_codon:yes stop_codon:yes gene_type:complete